MNGHDDESRGYKSPACGMHEHDGGDGDAVDDVAAWRRSERERLIALRRAIDVAERAGLDAAITARLEAVLGDVDGRCIAVYWPIRGEPDLKPWFARALAGGAELALPVVEGRDRPLLFRRYAPGDPLARGALGIPVPREGEVVTPSAVISPLVGFDDARHRLGNGGGYYDRTLAAMAEAPFTIGVGYERTRLRTVYPQTWDVPMDVIVTDAAIDRAEP